MSETITSRTTITISVSHILSYNRKLGMIIGGHAATDQYYKIRANWSVNRKPKVGEIIEATGVFRTHPVYGEQLHADTIRFCIPKGHLLVYYLMRQFAGIGKGKAQALWDAFQDQLPDVLNRGDVELLHTVLSDRTKLAQELIEAWQENQVEANIIVELDRMGFSPRLAWILKKAFGANAIQVIRTNPYVMLVCATWETVDAIARDYFGVGLEDERRLIGAVESVLKRRLEQKHTLTPHQFMVSSLVRLLGCPFKTAEHAISLALNPASPAIAGDKEKGYQTVPVAHMEAYLRKRILGIINREEEAEQQHIFNVYSWLNENVDFIHTVIGDWERQNARTLAPEQEAAVTMIVTEPFGLLLGGPGTGKTMVLKVAHEVIEQAKAKLGMDQQNSVAKIHQMALSGIARERIVEATDRPAYTIAGFRNQVARGCLSVIGDEIIIIDESSMLDLQTFYGIVSRMSAGTRFILVGDPHQLPPIGFGLTFHVLARSKNVPKITLTAVHRQLGETGIPWVAQQIRDGIVPVLPPYNGVKPGVSFLKCEPGQVVHQMLEVARKMGVHQAQVLCPTKNNVAGIRAVNGVFQSCLAAERKSQRLLEEDFAVDDPVIHLVNDYDRGLLNGSLGIVKEVFETDEECRLHCEFDGTLHEFDGADLNKLDLAYGITIHKSQGAAFPIVIIPIYRAPRIMDRTIIYTALTRGVSQVVFVGDWDIFKATIKADRMVDNRQVGISFEA